MVAAILSGGGDGGGGGGGGGGRGGGGGAGAGGDEVEVRRRWRGYCGGERPPMEGEAPPSASGGFQGGLGIDCLWSWNRDICRILDQLMASVSVSFQGNIVLLARLAHGAR